MDVFPSIKVKFAHALDDYQYIAQVIEDWSILRVEQGEDFNQILKALADIADHKYFWSFLSHSTLEEIQSVYFIYSRNYPQEKFKILEESGYDFLQAHFDYRYGDMKDERDKFSVLMQRYHALGNDLTKQVLKQQISECLDDRDCFERCILQNNSDNSQECFGNSPHFHSEL